jgi:hypothetical protein
MMCTVRLIRLLPELRDEFDRQLAAGLADQVMRFDRRDQRTDCRADRYNVAPPGIDAAAAGQMISRRLPGLMDIRGITQPEDAMRPRTQHTEFPDWQRLVGRWTTEATHPALPGTVVSGQATFEWLEDQQLLIQRSHYDHPEMPDALAVTGIIDGKPSMHYFDPRGVHRVFAVDITADTWRFWNDAPGFSQRFTGTFSDDDTINGDVELSRDDGATWAHDLAITYRRIG